MDNIFFKEQKSASGKATLILSWSLASVTFYFGLNEIISPKDWVAFVPGFLGSGNLANTLVIIHGIALCTIGLAFILNYYRRVAAALFCLMLLEIIFNLLFQSGLSDIVARDVGLFGAAAALFFLD